LLRFRQFFERKKLILNQVKRASHFVKIIVACPHRLPKLPQSTQLKQAIPNKGSLFYSHCGSRQADPALAPSGLDRGAHEDIELISTPHFDKFSVWSQKSCGNLKLRRL
jgi:hypothetical protein